MNVRDSPEPGHLAYLLNPSNAAAEGYLRSIIGEGDYGPLVMHVADILPSVNRALKNIVDVFVQQRGYQYRPEGQ
jgi:hypothetical protein